MTKQPCRKPSIEKKDLPHTIAVDIRSNPNQHCAKGLTARTMKVLHKCYYTSKRIFEQSFDIYLPSEGLAKEDSMHRRPVVLLVVGSAWAGHLPIIYWGTSWWNESGPKSIARAGYPCVCIRHRGSFPYMDALTILSVAVAFFLFFSLFVKNHVLAILLSLAWIALMVLGRLGCATHDDMVQDVATALKVLRDEHEIAAHRKVIFGGYSSGAHVAATLLAVSPGQWERWKLPRQPEEWISGILLVSGVLAVSSQPTSTSSHSTYKALSASATKSGMPLPPDRFAWATDFVTRLIFGPSWKASIPSPLYLHKPKIPHLLITCGTTELLHPAFKDVLAVYFCSRQYCRLLKEYQVPCRLVELKGVNHWTILNAALFQDCILTELPVLANSKAE